VPRDGGDWTFSWSGILKWGLMWEEERKVEAMSRVEAAHGSVLAAGQRR